MELVHLVDDPRYLDAEVAGRRVLLLSQVIAMTDDNYVVALGDVAARRRAAAACEAIGLKPATVIHPRVEMSGRVLVGHGAVICAGCILTTEVTVGNHVHINLSCTVGHDVSIGDFSTVSPGVHISGNVVIEQDVFVGTGVNIINGKNGSPLVIGAGSIIAAGACVTKSVEPGALMAGVPAVRKR